MILSTAGCGGGSGGTVVTQTGLGFIYADSTVLYEIHCYGVNPWSAEGEIHGGIDLVPTYLDLVGTSNTRKVEVVAPASGTIEEFIKQTSGAGAPMWSFLLKMNDYWYLIISFEPQSLDAAIETEQENSFTAIKGQTVSSGGRIGYLVLGSIIDGHYPHIHFGILYKNPQDSITDLLADFVNIPRNEGADLAPTSGPGSPFEPTDLGLASQFFCPYVYSSDEVKAIMDSVPRYATEECSCVCAYNSQNGDCGDCP